MSSENACRWGRRMSLASRTQHERTAMRGHCPNPCRSRRSTSRSKNIASGNLGRSRAWTSAEEDWRSLGRRRKSKPMDARGAGSSGEDVVGDEPVKTKAEGDPSRSGGAKGRGGARGCAPRPNTFRGPGGKTAFTGAGAHNGKEQRRRKEGEVHSRSAPHRPGKAARRRRSTVKSRCRRGRGRAGRWEGLRAGPWLFLRKACGLARAKSNRGA